MRRILVGAFLVAILASGFSLSRQVGGSLAAVALTVAQKGECGLSVNVTEGPYYVSGTSELKDAELNTTNLPGLPIVISGHVYEGAVGSKPLANSKIEIWHADSSGSYHPNSNGDVTKYKTQDLALRGFVVTDANGAYRFTTIYPGEYTGRTRHIHFKITAGQKALTTQLIIPSKAGDKIRFDEDTIAQGMPTCALLKFDNSVTPEAATFDFRL